MRNYLPRHLVADDAIAEPVKLRSLAVWYRKYAERTGNPGIWHARLATAEELEREAARLQERSNRRCVASPDEMAAKGNSSAPGE